MAHIERGGGSFFFFVKDAQIFRAILGFYSSEKYYKGGK
jgi:hypothetical protein